jgi:hypothetical protein
MLRATFKSPCLGCPDLALLLRKNENIEDGGSIASTFGTENTSFATGWPIRRPIAKSEEDWSTGLPKCITSESSAGTVENQNRSDRTPGDETLLARFGRCQPTSGTGPFSTLKTGPPDYVMLPRGSVGAACVQLVHRRDPRPSTVFRRIPT